ncbi:MAG: DUF1150 family protein [Rhodospirillaceae bacterium]|nr:DUF1150 family protein [Rhodospirillaceae bacterium]MBT5243355.1 DUF1150 family protein [Rhodospirillaceae bacterium]MBT5561260.1 DUF1150 family protein [Rhodospirillaceae bacterium]MBT6243335.1 DUF1150 family protein [Rhodospirillaceae bacterium]MBT7136942.1 DUF1150 family protein [Rhodospirillaceae bacterium]
MIQDPTTQTPINRYMSVADFALYGAQDVAYVKPVIINGEALYAIYAADGQELAFIEGRDLADATVRQNDMQPLSVH